MLADPNPYDGHTGIHLSNILPAYLRNPDAFITSAPKVNEVATPLEVVEGLNGFGECV